jgi:hypothetical protein
MLRNPSAEYRDVTDSPVAKINRTIVSGWQTIRKLSCSWTERQVGGKRWTNPKGTQSNSWRRKYRHTKHWPCSCQKKKSRSIYERQTEKVSFSQRTTRKGCERPKSLYVNSGLKAPINCFNFAASLAQGECAPMNGIPPKRRMMPLHSLCHLKHAIFLGPSLSSGLQDEHNRGRQPHQRNNEGR